jgi:hypothetical protein
MLIKYIVCTSSSKYYIRLCLPLNHDPPLYIYIYNALGFSGMGGKNKEFMSFIN